MQTQTQTEAGTAKVASMTHAEALTKAAKLLRLAQSDNPAEAALAMSKAQEIMDRFKLTGADIALDGATPVESVKHFAQDPLDIDGSARWKGQLGMVIARQNQCKLYGGSGGYCLIGRASDVQTVRYLYGWMTREIERLAARDCAGCGRTYWNNFRLGAVETVCAKLKAAAAATVATVTAEAQASDTITGGGMALALVHKSLAVIAAQEKEVDDYGKKVLHLRSRCGSRSAYNSSAREAGRRAGGEINIRPSAGSLRGGSLRLS